MTNDNPTNATAQQMSYCGACGMWYWGLHTCPTTYPDPEPISPAQLLEGQRLERIANALERIAAIMERMEADDGD